MGIAWWHVLSRDRLTGHSVRPSAEVSSACAIGALTGFRDPGFSYDDNDPRRPPASHDARLGPVTPAWVPRGPPGGLRFWPAFTAARGAGFVAAGVPEYPEFRASDRRGWPGARRRSVAVAGLRG